MPTTTQPNILFICTDQQRYDSLGCYGNKHIHTPTIDRLAAEGVLFERCYVQSPVCSPSRASLLTGRYHRSHGLWANGVTLPSHNPLFSRALAAAGYDCGLVGKWHQAAGYQRRTEPRLDDGFRVFQWAHDPTHGSPRNMYHRWLEETHPALYARAVANGFGRQGHQEVLFDTMPTAAHYSHWVAEKSIEFIEDQQRNQEQPFFLWANFFDPHHPFVAPAEYLAKYDPATLPIPVGTPDNLPSRPPILAEINRKSYGGHARGFAEYTPDEIQQVIAANYAMISLIDDEIQRILAALSAQGLDDNTLVIFTSDHGLMLKGPMMYEGAVRVPLIMRWLDTLPQGERRTELVQWFDLCPTFLEAAAQPPLPGNQAQSLLSLAQGKTDAPSRDWALCEYRDSGHPYDPPVHTTMLRTDRHKLIVYHGRPATDRPRTGELYDLETDPDELDNLWDNSEYAAIRTVLQELLLDVLVATEDRSAPREAFW